jgi:hypothetical protein
MKLNKQLNILVEEAKEFNVPPSVMERAIIPVLKSVARSLTHLTYYVMRDTEGNLLITTLEHREKKSLEKTVIYAFVNIQDGYIFHQKIPGLLLPEPTPVTHLLLEVFSIEKVDSIIFLEDSRNLQRGTEIDAEELRQAIFEQIRQLPTIYKA